MHLHKMCTRYDACRTEPDAAAALALTAFGSFDKRCHSLMLNAEVPVLLHNALRLVTCCWAPGMTMG